MLKNMKVGGHGNMKNKGSGSHTPLSAKKRFGHFNSNAHLSHKKPRYHHNHGAGHGHGHSHGHGFEREPKKLFVKNFESRNSLERLFARHNIEVEQMMIIDGKDYGFVTLKSESKVNQTVRLLNGSREGAYGNLTLVVDRARVKPKN